MYCRFQSLFLVVLGLAACTPAPPVLRIAGEAMGTTYEIQVVRVPDGLPEDRIRQAVADVLAEIDRHLSNWSPASEISRFNAAIGTEWWPASAILVEAVEQARRVSVDTGGAFDITVGPLVGPWGFGADASVDPQLPAPQQVQELRAGVGYGRLDVRRNPPALRKSTASLRIDVDGIAPGIAVDRIAARFEALGVRDYLIELGGEVRASGQNPSGRTWRVAVEAPIAGERRAHALLELDGAAVSTSGDYRDFREAGGRRISHTIDPRSGEPVRHRLTSVTVIHESTAMADAYATALMVLGPEEGPALAHQLGLAALFLERPPAPGPFIESATAQFEHFRRPLP